MHICACSLSMYKLAQSALARLNYGGRCFHVRVFVLSSYTGRLWDGGVEHDVLGDGSELVKAEDKGYKQHHSTN